MTVVLFMGSQTETKTDSSGRAIMTMEPCFISCCAIHNQYKVKYPWLKFKKKEQKLITLEKEILTCMSAVQIIDPLSFVLLRPQQLTQSVVVCTFFLSEDRGQSTAGFWGQSIQQSQTASHRNLHLWHRFSYSWRHSSRP